MLRIIGTSIFLLSASQAYGNLDIGCKARHQAVTE